MQRYYKVTDNHKKNQKKAFWPVYEINNNTFLTVVKQQHG